MPGALSMDLRERAMARLEAGETMISISVALGVSRSGISKWAAPEESDRQRRAGQDGRHQSGHACGRAC